MSPRPYVMRHQQNHFEAWSDLEFFTRFRLTKGTFMSLFGRIEEQLFVNYNRTTALSPINQIRLAKQGFYALAGFPRVIGCIDCTHIRIQSPGGDIAQLYGNRKGYFSLNVQVVCDSNLKATNIVARWPGSSHDATIFAHSDLYARFENRQYHKGVLLADGGYPVRNYLLTPLIHPVSHGEVRYNQSQIKTRNIIERFFGVWKRRFPVLSLRMRLKIETVQAIIVATAVLHNLARDAGEEEPPVLDSILIWWVLK